MQFIDILTGIFAQYNVDYHIPQPQEVAREESKEIQHEREELEKLQHITDTNRVIDILVGQSKAKSGVSLEMDNLEEVLLSQLQQESAPDFNYSPPIPGSKSESNHEWAEIYTATSASYASSNNQDNRLPVQRVLEKNNSDVTSSYDNIKKTYGI